MKNLLILLLIFSSSLFANDEWDLITGKILFSTEVKETNVRLTLMGSDGKEIEVVSNVPRHQKIIILEKDTKLKYECFIKGDITYNKRQLITLLKEECREL